jgi:hypothetical protein
VGECVAQVVVMAMCMRAPSSCATIHASTLRMRPPPSQPPANTDPSFHLLRAARPSMDQQGEQM